MLSLDAPAAAGASAIKSSISSLQINGDGVELALTQMRDSGLFHFCFVFV